MFTKSPIINIVVLLVISYFLVKFLIPKEKFLGEEEKNIYDEINGQKFIISKKIVAYINKDTKYSDYLNFLKKNGIVSYKLAYEDVFNEMKVLAKFGKLTPGIIFSYIKN